RSRVGVQHLDRGEARSEGRAERSIDLERHDPAGAAGEDPGQGAVARPDLDDDIGRRRRDEIDDGPGDRAITQEVLTEGAALVLRRHGRSSLGAGYRAVRAASSSMSVAKTRRTCSAVASRSPELSMMWSASCAFPAEGILLGVF